jgi:bifunctional DNA-binding transcriptional regulator/antitoxin component of YhaV-PrlF toxin-antitoxin module
VRAEGFTRLEQRTLMYLSGTPERAVRLMVPSGARVDRHDPSQHGCLVGEIMKFSEFRVSERGEMALPAAARHRWDLTEGGAVEVVDLGEALVITPVDRGGVRRMLREAVEGAGGYAELAGRVAADDPDLA